MLQDYPFLRQVRSPITDEQLRPLDPRCQRVQFDEPLSDSDHRKLAKFLKGYPAITFRVYGHDSKPCNLDFLEHYPFVRNLDVNVFKLADIAGFQHVSNELESFGFGKTKSNRFSLGFLRNFPNLKSLFVEGHTKDIEALGELANLAELCLRSITLPDLVILKRLKRLRSLDLKLGGTKDLRLLPEIGELRYLQLWMEKGLADLSPVGSVTTLEYLFLQALKNVRELPSFQRLRSLRRVHLETMKGLSDLRPVAEAPNIEELEVIDMRHLEAESFEPFLGHRVLKRAWIRLGSDKKSKAVTALLNLPDVKNPFRFSNGDVYK